MVNKKGLEIAISTVVIIVISVLVLIGLIIVFTNQSGIFNQNINLINSKTNVDAVVTSCNSLASTQQTFSYCCDKKDVTSGTQKMNLTCSELSTQSFIDNRINRLECTLNCSLT